MIVEGEIFFSFFFKNSICARHLKTNNDIFDFCQLIDIHKTSYIQAN